MTRCRHLVLELDPFGDGYAPGEWEGPTDPERAPWGTLQLPPVIIELDAESPTMLCMVPPPAAPAPRYLAFETEWVLAPGSETCYLAVLPGR